MKNSGPKGYVMKTEVGAWYKVTSIWEWTPREEKNTDRKAPRLPTHWDNKKSHKDSKSETEIRPTITVFNIYLFNILADSRQRNSIIKRNRWNKFGGEEIKYSLFAGNDYIAGKYQSFTNYQK